MSALAAFVADQITLEEFGRSEEARLLRDAGPLSPVPDGWQLPEPCDHEWVDVTGMGSPALSLLCQFCGSWSWRG